MVLEVAMLMVKGGLEQAFETSFRQASCLIASMPGYESHELHQCLEVPGKYLLLVRWKTLENHTVGFRDHRLIRNGSIFSITFMIRFQLLNILQKSSIGNLKRVSFMTDTSIHRFTFVLTANSRPLTAG